MKLTKLVALTAFASLLIFGLVSPAMGDQPAAVESSMAAGPDAPMHIGRTFAKKKKTHKKKKRAKKAKRDDSASKPMDQTPAPGADTGAGTM